MALIKDGEQSELLQRGAFAKPSARIARSSARRPADKVREFARLTKKRH
jgi:hypothetical protein